MADLPMEPTPEMLKAGAMRIAMNQQYVGTAEAKARMVWRDMVAAHTPADWTDDAMCLSGLADRLEEESATESDRGNDSTAAAWSCRAYELRQIISKMVRSNVGVSVVQAPSWAEVAQWLHAAYDRPPQTPEVKAMLARVDAASGVKGGLDADAFFAADAKDAAAMVDAAGVRLAFEKRMLDFGWRNFDGAVRGDPKCWYYDNTDLNARWIGWREAVRACGVTGTSIAEPRIGQPAREVCNGCGAIESQGEAHGSACGVLGTLPEASDGR